jgi:predicted transcriptional regulator
VNDVSRLSSTGEARTKDDQVVLRLKAMSEEAAYLASALATPPLDSGSADDELRVKRSKSPEEVLKLLIEMRRVRFRQFDPDLAADPGWDMMLDLMSARMAGREVPISNACVAAGVPATTALRLVNGLVAAGLVRRIPDPKDGRRVLVDLTEEGRVRMDVFLRSVGRVLG